jgi:hypothetical protein
MPIVDVQLVVDEGASPPSGAAQSLAEAMAVVFQAQPGRVWVRVHSLSSANYAENGAEVSGAELPVFVKVLHARPPQGEVLASEAAAISVAVGAVLDREPRRVHVEYAAGAAGRMAFGGNLVK